MMLPCNHISTAVFSFSKFEFLMNMRAVSSTFSGLQWKNNSAAVTCTFKNDCIIFVSQRKKEKPSLNVVNILLWRVACFLTTNDHCFF